MKNFPWLPIALAAIPILGAGLFGFSDLKSDVRVLDAAWAAGEENYRSLDVKVGSIQSDVREQGIKQAVTTQEVRHLQTQIEKLEKTSNASNREQANMLREILRNLNK